MNLVQCSVWPVTGPEPVRGWPLGVTFPKETGVKNLRWPGVTGPARAAPLRMRQRLFCVPSANDLGWRSLLAWWQIPRMLAFACSPFRGILYSPLARLESGIVATVPSATLALAGCVQRAAEPVTPSQYSTSPDPMPDLWMRASMNQDFHDASVPPCPVPVGTRISSAKTRCERKVTSLC